MSAVSGTLLMRCPRCLSGLTTLVLVTRHRADGSVRRRHTCLDCAIRWTTTESISPGSIRVAVPPKALAAAKGRQPVAEQA
jgi:transcriptional regulator NrdR family protein